MGESIVKVASCAVRNFAKPVPLGTMFIYRFVKDILPLEKKIFLYTIKTVPTLAIEDLSEKWKDRDGKAQDAMMKWKEHAHACYTWKGI